MFRFGWAKYREGAKEEGLKSMRGAIKLDSSNIAYLTKTAEILMRESD